MKVAEPRTLALLGIIVLAMSGCLKPRRIEPFPPAPLPDAVRFVNDNIGRIDGTLRATGSVDGHITLEDGRRRSFHLEGTMFYLAPRCFRLDLRKLGTTQILIGSNTGSYWFQSKNEEVCQCGRHGEQDELSADFPVSPHELIEALGLTPIPAESEERGITGCVQRIVDEHQQVLFVAREDDGRIKLRKEYWLDRVPPRLVGRVIFRDADGAVEMESRLEGYERVGGRGPRLPTVIAVDWPQAQTSLRFRIRRWTVVPQVGPDGVQFATPRECLDGSQP